MTTTIPDLGQRRGNASLRAGIAVLWLSVIVLLPLAAIGRQAVGGGWGAFWSAVTSHAALQSFRVTLTIAAGVTVLTNPCINKATRRWYCWHFGDVSC